MAIHNQIAIAIKILQDVLDHIQEDAVFPQEKMKLVEERKCLECLTDLGDGVPKRGCHSACYQSLNRLVRLGYESDESLVSEGRWLPSDKQGRKPMTREERIAHRAKSDIKASNKKKK
jgi:hypothetical protein